VKIGYLLSENNSSPKPYAIKTIAKRYIKGKSFLIEREL